MHFAAHLLHFYNAGQGADQALIDKSRSAFNILNPAHQQWKWPQIITGPAPDAVPDIAHEPARKIIQTCT